jgi:hypothetical protein
MSGNSISINTDSIAKLFVVVRDNMVEEHMMRKYMKTFIAYCESVFEVEVLIMAHERYNYDHKIEQRDKLHLGCLMAINDLNCMAKKYNFPLIYNGVIEENTYNYEAVKAVLMYVGDVVHRGIESATGR